MNKIATDNEEEELNNLNETEQNGKNVAKAGAEKGKQEAEKAAKKLAEKAAKDPKLMSAIAAALPVIIIVLIVILIIIIVIGLIGFLAVMPSMILGKIQKFCQSIWADFNGFWTGDSITASVDQEDMINLAQYIQNMGYDIQGYGFADVTYTTGDSMDETEGKTKEIKSINKIESTIEKYGVVNNAMYSNLQVYISANEATYVEAHYSVNGMWDATGQNVNGIFHKVSANSKDAASYSTGLINIDDNNSNGVTVKVNPTEQKMYMTTKAKFFGNSTFTFDLSNWTAIYGRPLELFLSLHLATMMPDLTYIIATDQHFNTKVNINVQDINVKYSVNLGDIKFENTPSGTTNKNDAQKNMDQFVDLYLNNYYSIENYTGQDDIDVAIKKHNAKLAKIKDDTEKKMLYFIALKSLAGFSNDSDTPSGNMNVLGLDLTYKEIRELAALICKGIQGTNTYWPYIDSVTNHWYYDDISFTNGYNYGAYKKTKTATKTIKYEPEESSLTQKYNITLNAELQSDEGIYYQVCEPETNGPNQYIKTIFSSKYYKYDGTITTAKKIAIAKAIDSWAFEKVLKKYKIDASLIGNVIPFGQFLVPFITSNDGESVNISSATLNEYIEDHIDEFSGSYTFEGEKIDITKDDIEEYKEAKKAEEEGTSNSDSPMCKQSVSFTDNKANALSAFTILEKIDTEEANEAYRNLKELMVNLQYFTEEEMTQNESQVLLWIIDNGKPGFDDNLNEENSEIIGTLTKDSNDYGIKISNLSGDNVKIVAPDDCNITQSGDVATITFKVLSDETLKILNYRYKGEFKSIDSNVLAGMSMQIKVTGIKFTKSGDVKRGEVIGEVTNKGSNSLQIQMFKADKTVVDNIESYMTSKYTKTDEDKLKIAQKSEEKIVYGNQYGNTQSSSQSSTIQSSGTHSISEAESIETVKSISNENNYRQKWLFPNGVPTRDDEEYIASAAMVSIKVPVLDTKGNKSYCSITCHYKLVNAIMAAFEGMVDIGFPVHDASCYCYRPMTGLTIRSNHSYGCCVDINPNENPINLKGEQPDKNSPYYITREVADIWKQYGFYWGGDWSSRNDPMHFTYTNH